MTTTVNDTSLINAHPCYSSNGHVHTIYWRWPHLTSC